MSVQHTHDKCDICGRAIECWCLRCHRCEDIFDDMYYETEEES